MCGIFGQITPGRPVDLQACYRATQTLAHRGPDGLGILVGRLQNRATTFALHPTVAQLRNQAPPQSDLFLGHRRLAILDLAPEAFQPMTNEDRTVWVVFNGEIYNHQELRARLLAHGHQFRTDHSDTETLVHGYEEWGDRLVDELRGMFAFGLVDLRKRTLLLARDRFGEKPLYYASGAWGVAFASELKALTGLAEVDLTLSPDALVDYFAHSFIPAPRTIYQKVQKLRAAEQVTISLDTPDLVRPSIYWSCVYKPEVGASKARWREEFGAQLQDAIHLRLMSDVPLGMFLSGGLDSTIVVAEASRKVPHQLSTFSIGFTEKTFDELPYAERVAAHYQTRHHQKILRPADLLDAVPRITKVFDEPFADSSAIPMYVVSCLAREHVTVALSGDGGDELLAGYPRYQFHWRLARKLAPWPSFLLDGVMRSLTAAWPEWLRGRGMLRFLIRNTKTRYMNVFLDDCLTGLAIQNLAPNWQNSLEAAWPDALRHPIDQMCLHDQRIYIPEDLMVKVDRTSMATSLEARAPLLDHKLFEFVGRMPLETRFDGRHGKLPFRQQLTADLGPDFVARPKQGFAVPLDLWFRHELRDDLYATLLSPEALVTSLFGRQTVETLIQNLWRGGRAQGPRLWRLYMLEKWHENHGQCRSDSPTSADCLKAA